MAAETGKPGTNWKQIGPHAAKKLGPLVRHYMSKPHPFTACVRDNTKRFGPERAKKVCAVLKDFGSKTTKWRKGGKLSESQIAGLLLYELVEAGIETEHDVKLLEGYMQQQADAQLALEEGEGRADHSDSGHRQLKCPKCGRKQSASNKLCRGCGHDLGDARRAKFAKLDEARAAGRAAGRAVRGKGKPPPARPTEPHSEPSGGLAAGTPEPERVAQLQRRLGSLGHELMDDGDFGEKTDREVRAFQRAAGLKDDGVVGPRTAERLRGAPTPEEMEDDGTDLPSGNGAGPGSQAAGAEGTRAGPDEPGSAGVVPPFLHKGTGVGAAASPAVKDMQVELGTVGYGLEADGVFGPDTETAVKRFQKKWGLRTDGLVGPKTQRTLKGAAKKVAQLAEARETRVAAYEAGDSNAFFRARARETVLRRHLEEGRLEEVAIGTKVVASIKRLPNGTFAPKGQGQVLTPGQRVTVPHKSGNGVVPGRVVSPGKVRLDGGPDKGTEIDVPTAPLLDFEEDPADRVIGSAGAAEHPLNKAGTITDAKGRTFPAEAPKLDPATHAVIPSKYQQAQTGPMSPGTADMEEPDGDAVPEAKGLQPNAENLSLKDVPLGSTIEMNDGGQYVVHKVVNDPWMVMKPVGGGKAKPIHKMLAPPKIDTSTAYDAKATAPSEMAADAPSQASVQSYDPKTGPSEEQKAANAAKMGLTPKTSPAGKKAYEAGKAAGKKSEAAGDDDLVEKLKQSIDAANKGELPGQKPKPKAASAPKAKKKAGPAEADLADLKNKTDDELQAIANAPGAHAAAKTAAQAELDARAEGGEEPVLSDLDGKNSVPLKELSDEEIASELESAQATLAALEAAKDSMIYSKPLHDHVQKMAELLVGEQESRSSAKSAATNAALEAYKAAGGDDDEIIAILSAGQ